MKKAIIAIVFNINDIDKFNLYMKKFDDSKYDIHMFNINLIDIVDFYILQKSIIYLNQKYEYESVSVLSNIKNLLFLWAKAGYKFIDEYILYAVENTINCNIYGINEKNNELLNNQPQTVRIIFDNYNMILPILIENLLDIENVNIINKKFSRNINKILNNSILRGYLSYISKKYNIDHEFGLIVSLQALGKINVRDSSSILNYLLELFNNNPNMRKSIEKYCNEILCYFELKFKISILSFLYKITCRKFYALKIFKLIYSYSDKLSIRDKSTVYWYLIREIFVGKLELDVDEKIYLRNFYNSFVEDVSSKINYDKHTVEHNKNKVVIITGQFLGMLHAPTRNVIDYAISLKNLGKDVLIINSTDMNRNSSIPLCNAFEANFISEYNKINQMKFGNNSFDFYQTKVYMPNIKEINKIINKIYAFNPEFILSIGDCNLTADLCNEFIDVVTIPCGSRLPTYCKGYWALPRKILSQDKPFIEKGNMNKDKVFSIHYAFMKKNKTHQYERKNFGLNKNHFVLAVVGNRLDLEVDEKFLEKIEYIICKIPQVFILFIGKYKNYYDIIKEYPILQNKTKYIGFKKDIQSVYSICNCYLNPRRKGGATSAAEAMLEGLPIISEKFGDVYYQCWLDRSFDNKSDVVDFIKKCISDELFYKNQKLKYKKMGDKIFNADNMLLKILNKVANNE